jgi:hypothetical protein
LNGVSARSFTTSSISLFFAYPPFTVIEPFALLCAWTSIFWIWRSGTVRCSKFSVIGSNASK